MTDKPQHDDPEFLLSQYLDGQLDARDEARMKRRLEEDPRLQEELRAYSALEERLGSLAEEEIDGVDYDLQRQSIMAALERRALLEGHGRGNLVLRPVFRVTAAAAALAIAIGAGLWIYSRQATPVAPAAPAQQVAMEVLPEQQIDVHQIAQMVVDAPRLDVDLLSASQPGHPEVLPPIAPAGTIYVSYGRPDLSQEPTGIDFPIGLE